jgi:TRAP-type C4-dicarboxylate transport system permease small subunit
MKYPAIFGLLILMVWFGLGAVFLAIRTNSPTDWLSGIGLFLVAVALGTVIATVGHMVVTKADKLGGP